MKNYKTSPTLLLVDISANMIFEIHLSIMIIATIIQNITHLKLSFHLHIIQT